MDRTRSRKRQNTRRSGHRTYAESEKMPGGQQFLAPCEPPVPSRGRKRIIFYRTHNARGGTRGPRSPALKVGFHLFLSVEGRVGGGVERRSRTAYIRGTAVCVRRESAPLYREPSAPRCSSATAVLWDPAELPLATKEVRSCCRAWSVKCRGVGVCACATARQRICLLR